VSALILSVASGKGGTGKTLVATGLTAVAEPDLFVDADVESPNAHIFLKPRWQSLEQVEVAIPEFDEEQCTLCGDCADFCRFQALMILAGQRMFFPQMCHGCGGCQLVCSRESITMGGRAVGTIRKGKCDSFTFLDGLLEVGEASAMPVIRMLKKQIAAIGQRVIVDCPPGTACPTVEAIRESDYCILVTEPTAFGLHDLDAMVKVIRELNIPAGVVINRQTPNSQPGIVEDYCQKQDLPLLGVIPFSRKIAAGYALGSILPEIDRKWSLILRQIWAKVQEDQRVVTQ